MHILDDVIQLLRCSKCTCHYEVALMQNTIFLDKSDQSSATGGKETLHDVWKYNASLNKWIQIEFLNTGRWRHKMAVLGGKVYVLGGFDGIHRLNSVEAYDPFHNSWTEVSADDLWLIITVSYYINDVYSAMDK